MLRARSQFALHDEGRNMPQRVGAIAEALQRAMCSRFELARQIHRAFDSEYRWIRRFAALEILLRALAHLLRCALTVEQIIDDLEREPERARVRVERLDLRRASAAESRTAAHRRQEQRAGFFAVQL